MFLDIITSTEPFFERFLQLLRINIILLAVYVSRLLLSKPGVRKDLNTKMYMEFYKLPLLNKIIFIRGGEQFCCAAQNLTAQTGARTHNLQARSSTLTSELCGWQ